MRWRMKNGQGNVAVVAGGAGFIGSHLCQALLNEEREVICIDNLQTSRPSNLNQLEGRSGFTFLKADIVDPLPDELLERTREIDRVYNLACAASPPQYQAD